MRNLLTGIGLLVLRLGAGTMLIASAGWFKVQNYADLKEKFPDPLGVGSSMSLNLVIFAEVGCAALVILGLLSRLATVPIVFTMCVAAFVAHGDDPWLMRLMTEEDKGAKETALLYGLPFLALLFTGPGPFSIDHLIFGRRAKILESSVEKPQAGRPI